LHLGATQGLVGLTLRLLRASPSVDFGGGDCCQKGGRHASVDRRRAQTLADWLVVLLAQVIANVLATALIAYGHLVSAFAAPGDAMKESRTVTWNAAGLVVQIFRPIVAQHGLDALEGFPIHIGWIFVLHDDPPFLVRLPGGFPGVFYAATDPRGSSRKRRELSKNLVINGCVAQGIIGTKE